jgi:uncharacterized Zn-finger protein
MSDTATQVGAAIMVGAGNLPLHCPGPKTPLWDAHPRVFLDLESNAEARCPYCGTLYRLADPSAVKAHH